MISGLVITKNEEEHLRGCLESLKWCDEIVVVDSGSSDKTLEIAKSYTKKIFHHDWVGYSEQKNWGSEKCEGDWIFSIDADERVSEDLQQEIKSSIIEDKFRGYFIPTLDFMFGKWIRYGQWYPQEHIRLYQKSHGRWEKSINETVKMEGEAGHLGNPILHVGHSDISEFVEKLNKYTQLEAEENFAAGVRESLIRISLRSIKMFFIEYLKFRGYKDGGHGFILAVLMAFYKLNTGIKTWEKWYKKDHAKEIEAIK